MGTWGTGLYSDDIALDVRSDCNYYFSKYEPEKALDILLNVYYNPDLGDGFGDNATVIYAIADFMWKKGILTGTFKSHVLALLDSYAGMDEWIESGNEKDIIKRKSVLDKFKEKILSPMPLKKKIIYRTPAVKPAFKIGQIIKVTIKDESKKDIWGWSYDKYELVKSFVPTNFFDEAHRLGLTFYAICVDIRELDNYQKFSDGSCINFKDGYSIIAIYDWCGYGEKSIWELKTLPIVAIEDIDERYKLFDLSYDELAPLNKEQFKYLIEFKPNFYYFNEESFSNNYFYKYERVCVDIQEAERIRSMYNEYLGKAHNMGSSNLVPNAFLTFQLNKISKNF